MPPNKFQMQALVVKARMKKPVIRPKTKWFELDPINNFDWDILRLRRSEIKKIEENRSVLNKKYMK